MNVLLLGANGYMGPHVVRALAGEHHLRLTDIQPPPPDVREAFKDHEFRDVDVTDPDQVASAAEGMDAIVNFAVVRRHPALAFHVNTLGCFHVMQAAVALGIRRVINTGPHFTVAGPRYQRWDHGIGPDVPPHPGTGLYPITKSLGQEICRSFTEVHDVHVLEFLFYSLRDKEQLRAGAGGAPFVVSWTDAGEAFRSGLQIDLARLPSKCEVFFIFADVPQAVFLNDKAKRVLGFAPRDDVSLLWRKPR